MVVKSNAQIPTSVNLDYARQIKFSKALLHTFPPGPCMSEPPQGSKPAFTAMQMGEGNIEVDDFLDEVLLRIRSHFEGGEKNSRFCSSI